MMAKRTDFSCSGSFTSSRAAGEAWLLLFVGRATAVVLLVAVATAPPGALCAATSCAWEVQSAHAATNKIRYLGMVPLFTMPGLRWAENQRSDWRKRHTTQVFDQQFYTAA